MERAGGSSPPPHPPSPTHEQPSASNQQQGQMGARPASPAATPPQAAAAVTSDSDSSDDETAAQRIIQQRASAPPQPPFQGAIVAGSQGSEKVSTGCTWSYNPSINIWARNSGSCTPEQEAEAMPHLGKAWQRWNIGPARENTKEGWCVWTHHESGYCFVEAGGGITGLDADGTPSPDANGRYLSLFDLKAAYSQSKK